MVTGKVTVKEGGLFSRLGRFKDALFQSGKRLERKVNEGNDVGGKAEGVPDYRTDAEESLAMALGKDVGKGFGGDAVSGAVEDALRDL